MTALQRILSAIVVLAPGALHAAGAATTSSDPVTVMSPYEVSANSVEFTGWIKRGSPNFIVYTDARASEASRVLREFEMLHAAGQAVFNRKAARYSPTILILPTERSDWRKLETKGGAQEWKIAVTMVGGEVTHVIVAQYDWEQEGLGLLRTAFSTVDMKGMQISGPFWYEHGFGMFYETAEFDGDRVRLGRINPRVLELRERQWIPWGRFFQINPLSPEYLKEDKVGLYEAQTALFTQYLFSNSDRAWAGRLMSWVEYLQTGEEPTEAQFTSIFGQNWKQWQDTMRNYLDGGSYRVFQVPTAPSVTHYQETKFDLPVREIRELFVLTQTLLQEVPQSQTSLDALLAHGLKSECLRELLTEACIQWGSDDAALENIRKLIADGSTNALVYRQGDALLTKYAGPFTLDRRYGPELTLVRAWDRHGLELEPLDADLWMSLASNEACAPVVDQQGISTIEQCYRSIRGRVPTDEVITDLAVALWRIGDTKTATALAVKLRDDPMVRKRWRGVATQLLGRMGAAGTAAAR